MFKRRLTASVMIASVLLGTLVSAAVAERRVALVVGNANYNDRNLNLSNPKNDAADVAKVLRSIGFETVETTDATKRDFERALEQFAMAASQADSVLFYYAGHAMQFQGRNHLMPIDARLENEFSVRYQTVSTDDVRDALDRSNGVKIMILDACRNNPLAERLKTTLAGQRRSVGNVRGLARIDTTQGMVVAYATGADQVALDGSSRNSPFTTALLRRMQEPGVEIGMMFRQVTKDVFEETKGRQRPATYTDLTTTYYLNQSDRLAWDRIKDSTDPTAFGEFIRQFPSSPLALTAKSRMDMFNRFVRERRETQALLDKLVEERRLLAEAAARREEEEDGEARRKAAEQQRAEQEAAKRREAEERQEREVAKRREQERLAALAAAERKRVEQQAAQRREAEALAARERQEREIAEQREQQGKVALAAAERRRTEQEAAKRREAEEQAKAAAEQERLEREAAQRREAEEQQARVAAERARQEAEAARIREQEQQALVAAAERMRAEQAAARRAEQEAARLRDQERAQLAAEAAQRLAARQGTEAERVEQEPAKPSAVAVAALDNPPAAGPRIQAAPADTPALVRAAQRELRRLGCFSGRENGSLNDQTRDAVKKYHSGRGQQTAAIVITDEFVSDLKAHRRRVCEPPRPVVSRPPKHEPTRSKPRSRPSVDRTISTREAPPRQPAPAASAPKGQRRMIGIGF
ncbi:MAG: hypothetical protein GEU91_11845 [Rhizobiales bacterium]|nr:hypothetical protein [Hyphomicrobiales bacterium]